MRTEPGQRLPDDMQEHTTLRGRAINFRKCTSTLQPGRCEYQPGSLVHNAEPPQGEMPRSGPLATFPSSLKHREIIHEDQTFLGNRGKEI